jgi:hypothetical protein
VSGPVVTIAELERRIIELEEALVAMEAVSAGEAISYEDACRHDAVLLSAMDAVRARRQSSAKTGKEVTT